MGFVPHSAGGVRGRVSPTPSSSAALRAEFYYRLRGFKKDLQLHPQMSVHTTVVPKIEAEVSSPALPAVAVAVGAELAHEFASLRKVLAEMPGLVLQQARIDADSRLIVAADRLSESFSLSQVGILEQTKGLLAMFDKANGRICKTEEAAEELRKEMQTLSDRLTSCKVMGGASTSPSRPPLGGAPCPDYCALDSDDDAQLSGMPEVADSQISGVVAYPSPYPLVGLTLILDSEDEDFLDGLSEDERCDVLEERRDALQLLPVEQRGEALQRVASDQRAERHFL